MTNATLAPERPESLQTRRVDGLRPDIQALRAVAVLGVVLYHLWPGALPGGFVGVDVFFVISGFLITSHLLKHPPARVGEFASFWSRRVLRLLPPVFVVLIATVVGFLALLPSGQWRQLARETVTSMFYVQNWQLISDATDYLDAHRAVSPFQHFWSLSVEEQYYIIWPFLVGVLAFASRRYFRGSAWVIAVGFTVATLASFVFSVVQTTAAPAEAYFSTWTRMWELGIGSALAAFYPMLKGRLTLPARLALLWAGLGGIALAYLLIDGGTPFPGYAAALPTIATALVILAGDPPHRANPRGLSHAGPVQFVGDCSYALYLWHWPLIVIAPYALGHEPSLAQKLGLLGLAVLCSWLSTRFLETPVRSSRYLRARLRRVFTLGLAMSGSVLLLGLAVTWHVDRQVAEAAEKVQAGMRADEECFGAAAMDPKHDCVDIHGEKLLTTPEFTKDDVTSGIRECLNWPPFPEPAISCARGETADPTKRIALFGNSHAGQWTEALSRIGKRNGWAVDTYIVGACFSYVEPQAENCNKIVQEVVDRITDGEYDAVVMASFDSHETSSAASYTSTIDTFTDAGSRVLVIRDTPAPWDEDNEPTDCVARNLSDVKACSGTPKDWITQDPLAQAADESKSPDVSMVDLNRYLCTRSECPAVIGGLIVFSDYNHLAKTFSRTLAPYLEPAVKAAVGS